MTLNKLNRFILFILFFSQTCLGFASYIQNQQHVDSLIADSQNRVYDKPDESIKLGLSVFEDIDNSITSRVRSLVLVSLAYSSKRDYQKALDYIIKANEFSTKFDDTKLQLEILFMTGIIYQQLKIFDKSIEFMEKIETIALKQPINESARRSLANSYIVKGFIYKDNLNCDIALEFFNKGIREYEKIKKLNSNANTSIAYYNKGNCYILLSDYINAKNSFYKSIEFAELENANSLISFAKKGLAEVYTLEGNYDRAIDLLLSAFQQSKDVGDLVLNQGLYKGLFENYLALNQWEEYQTYHDLYLKTQLEIKISERNSICDSIDKNIVNQGNDLYHIQNKYRTRLKWSILIVLVIIAITLFLEKKNKKAIKSLQKDVDTLKNLKSNL